MYLQQVLRKVSFYHSILILSISILASCNNETSGVTNKSETQVKKVTTFPFEDLNDPEYYKTPRLQFIIMSNTDNGWESVWTMKLDGTDVRKVIDPRKMFPGNKPDRFVRTPVRSPNRRFIAYAIKNVEHSIIDLKTGKVATVSKKYDGYSNYAWSKDSELLFFYDERAIYRYKLLTKKVEKFKKQSRVTEIFTLDDGKTIVLGTVEGAVFIDYDGNEIKRYNFKNKKTSSKKRFITPDGKYILVVGSQPDIIFELLDSGVIARELNYKEQILKYYPESSDMGQLQPFNIFDRSKTLGPNAEFLYIDNNWKFVKYNINTGEIITIFTGRGMTVPHSFTILN